MNTESFVESVRVEVQTPAAAGCLEQYAVPAGREPSERLKRISAWYRSLSPTDRSFVAEVTHDAADAAVFGLLCVLDGVRVLEPNTKLELWAVQGTTRTQLNGPANDLMHDLYNAT